MVEWWTWDNPDRSFRSVQCPECGSTGYSGKKFYQCNGPKRHRFTTDDNLLKTLEDRYLERQKLDKELQNELIKLEKEKEEFLKNSSDRREWIQRMRQQIKPLYPPKQKEESKPEKEIITQPVSSQQAVTQ